MVAMLLQMVFEKLAKAALLRKGALTIEKARTTHKASFLLIGVLRRRSLDGRRFGFRHGAQWNEILNIVLDLERAHPQLCPEGPHLEYPWESPDGEVRWPERHLEIIRRLSRPKERQGPVVIQLAGVLAREFDRFFP